MKRSGWRRILDKDYISDSGVLFDKYPGVISLSVFKKITEPLVACNYFSDTLIVDNNYKWLQIALKDQHFWITAMFDKDDNFIQLYVDITKQNCFLEPDNPYFYDLYLDIVVTNNKKVYILDRDELDIALENNNISKDDYDLAISVCNFLYNYLIDNSDYVIKECCCCLNKLKSKFRSV